MSFHARNLPSILCRLSLVAALALGAAACGDDDLTPEEALRQRVKDRLQLAYTDEQVDCMLDQLSDQILAGLDGEGNIPEGEDFDTYSAITRACILGTDETTPGSPSPEADDTSTTVAPPGDAPADDTTTEPGSNDGSETTAETVPQEPTEPEAPTTAVGSGSDRGDRDDDAPDNDDNENNGRGDDGGR